MLNTWVAILGRDMPFGALQLSFYELAKLAVEGPGGGWAPGDGGSLAAHLLEGSLAGGITGATTTPIDCVATRLMIVKPDLVNPASGSGVRNSQKNIRGQINAIFQESAVCRDILRSLCDFFRNCFTCCQNGSASTF